MRARLAIVALAICFAQTVPFLGQATAADSKIETEIQEMERKYFQHDFSTESLNYRVARLEKFAFGEPSTGPVEARISRLESVIDLHKALVPQTVPGDPSDSLPAAPVFTENDIDPSARAKYPHVTTLESQILGKTFEAEPVNERLARLEMKAFGKASANPDLASRTDALEEYIERKLPHKPYYNSNSQLITAEGYSQPVVSQSSAQSVIPQSSAQPVMVRRRATMFPGSFMPVFSQSPVVEDSQEETPRVMQPVNPVVYSDQPPSANERMLTRVEWCEQHVYGRTFPELHLMQRLHQLNARLFPQKVNVPDIQLMDRLDVIVREVVMIQHPPLVSTKQR